MNEKQQRIQRLKDSLPIVATGDEYVGLYDLNNKSAEKYIRQFLRGNYINRDTGDIIRITRKGAEKVTRHDAESVAHLQSIALIPTMIKEAIYITEESNEKDKTDYESFRYYVVGLIINNEDYTAKIVVGVKNGETYYDHALTKIEKNNLLRSIDEIKRPFASKETTDDESQAFDILSECKDKRIISILQTF